MLNSSTDHRLELGSYQVDEVVLGARTHLSDHVLTINKRELEALLVASGPFEKVDLSIVPPGDATRLIHVVDIIEPRIRTGDSATNFPGLLGLPTTVGRGRTNCLKGVSILEVAEPLPGEPVYWREGLVDMGGVGARYSPFSELINITLDFKPKADLLHSPDAPVMNMIRGSEDVVEYGRAVRKAGLLAAVYLAQATVDLVADSVQTFDLASAADSILPRIAYMFQGAPYIYGQIQATGGSYGGATNLPTILHPNEFFDGALVNPSTTIASIRMVTYLFQNHPIIEELYRQHGKQLNFAGVVQYTNGDSVRTKDRISSFAASLAMHMGADGAVLNYTGGGHSAVDFMQTCQKLEQSGIKTTLLSPEMAVNPEDSGFVHFVREADSIVSTGNYEHVVDLPAVGRVIGGTHILVSGAEAAGPLKLPLRNVVGSTSQFGYFTIAGRQA